MVTRLLVEYNTRQLKTVFCFCIECKWANSCNYAYSRLEYVLKVLQCVYYCCIRFNVTTDHGLLDPVYPCYCAYNDSCSTSDYPMLSINSGKDSCHSSEWLSALRDKLDQFYPKVRSIKQCGEGLWYKVLSVNMSDANSQCPDGWVEENVGGVRACGRGTAGRGCKSVYLRNDMSEYTKVCGKAIATSMDTPMHLLQVLTVLAQ